MKKKILLISLIFFLLLIPIRIKAANVEIKEVEILEKSAGLTEISKPTYKDLKVDFDLGFKELNDSIKYKLTLKNNDESDYEVSDETKYSDDKHIRYDVSYEDKDNIIKAKSEKTVYITVTYENAVGFEEFLDGVYEEKNNVVISLAQKEKNPNTLVYGSVAIAAVLLIISILVFVYSRRKQKVLMSLILLTAGLIPLITIALETINIEISATIKIDPPVKEAHLFESHCNGPDDREDIGYVEFLDGMTWNDYFDVNPEDEDSLIYSLDISDSNTFLVGSGLDICLAELDEVEEPGEDASDDELDAYFDYLDRIADCYDNNMTEVTLEDELIPKTEGYYIVYLCK